MLYNGKTVYTTDTFDYSKAKPGDYVDSELVADMMDLLPPACMTNRCSQVGEPYSTRLDPTNGKYRDTYSTFTRVSRDVWMYCGNCFLGEIEERGTEPPYVRLDYGR